MGKRQSHVKNSLFINLSHTMPNAHATILLAWVNL